MNEMNGVVILEQGTQEWLDFRKHHFCASEIVKLDNAKRKEVAFQRLYDVKNGIITIKDNPFMARGREYEPRARELAECKLGVDFMPQCLKYDEYFASLDGINFECNTIIEIKTSIKDIYYIQDYYKLQFMQQYMIASLIYGHDITFYLVVYRVENDNVEIVSIPKNAEYINAVKDLWFDYAKFVKNISEKSNETTQA